MLQEKNAYGTCLANPGTPVRDEEMPEGDCFVVVNAKGECWDGKAWAANWGRALKFRRPAPAYEMCVEEARGAEQQTGVKGLAAYIPPGASDTRLDGFEDPSDVVLRDLPPTQRAAPAA
jgi:hypothetical protein